MYKIENKLKLFKHTMFLRLFLLVIGLSPTIVSAAENTITANALQIFLAVTILGLAPSILVMCTSFVRIMIVLSIIRTALGLQQSPPNQVLISLALFLTFFIMSPVLEKSYNEGLLPFLNSELNEQDALPKIIKPFKKFMVTNTRSKDLELFMSIAKIDFKIQDYNQIPLQVMTPAFMISELRRGFEIGFVLFLPFLIIDLVVSSILMAMGMMMMPPVVVSLPIKIIFFIIVDGWYLLAGSLVKSFGVS